MDVSCKYIFTVLLGLAFLSGCTGSTLPDFPDVGIEQSQLNEELEIISLASNTYKINEPIELIVRLQSDIEVYTDSNFGARMFVLEKGSRRWEEVYDPVTSYSEELNIDLNEILGGTDEFILSANDPDKLNQLMVILHPTTKSNNDPIKLLIVLTGQIYENGAVTEKKVGAYTIITLRP